MIKTFMTLNQKPKKQCPHCKSDIDAEATKCSQCQSDLRNWFIKHKFVSGILILIAVFTIPGWIAKFTAKVPQGNGSIANGVGCIAPNPTIGYSLLGESARQSDVKDIFIKECYILLKKKAPTVAELTQLVTALGKNNENIEFKFFDDPRAYKLYEKYVTQHKEGDASEEEWKFLYDHHPAWYLKANTYLSNNYLQLVGNAYYAEGQTSIPKIPIVN